MDITKEIIVSIIILSVLSPRTISVAAFTYPNGTQASPHDTFLDIGTEYSSRLDPIFTQDIKGKQVSEYNEEAMISEMGLLHLKDKKGKGDYIGEGPREKEHLLITDIKGEQETAPAPYHEKGNFSSLEYAAGNQSSQMHVLRNHLVDNKTAEDNDKILATSSTFPPRKQPQYSRKILEIANVQEGEGSSRLSSLRSLTNLLFAIISNDLSKCDLTIVYDGDSFDQMMMNQILVLPNVKQVLRVRSLGDFSTILWKSSQCRGYLFFNSNLELLLNFTNILPERWDYEGRYVFVNVTLNQLTEISRSLKGKKTQDIVGVVKQGGSSTWGLYINLLYWETGVKRINTWLMDRFTHQATLFPDKVKDLKGAQLKIVTFVWEPSIMYFKNESNSIIYPYGLDIAVINTLAQSFNFTVSFMEPPK
ncbi:hypothetical protein SK128_011513, partial [Halocaridina rubra]